MPERGYELALIPAVPLPRKPTPELITLPGRLRGAVKAVQDILERTKADAVVGFGGYVAMPAYLAAKRAGVPIVVHEANARPGVANKIRRPLHRLRRRQHPGQQAPGTPAASASRCRHTIATLDRNAARPEARAYFGLDQRLPTLLVSGGSQGARRLNETIQAIAPRLQQYGVQILHAVGPKDETPGDRRRPRGCRRTGWCRTWTGWTWPTPPPT